MLFMRTDCHKYFLFYQLNNILSFSYWVFSHKLTSVVKGRFSHWTPGKMSGKVTFWPSLSAAPGGFLRAFSNKREKRWSSQVLFILSENALYNNDTMRINQTLRTQGKAAVVTVCMLQYLQNAVAKNTPSATAWSSSMDTNRSLVTKTIFMPPSPGFEIKKNMKSHFATS